MVRRIRTAVLVIDVFLNDSVRMLAIGSPSLLATWIEMPIAQIRQQVAKPRERLRRQSVPAAGHPQQPIEAGEQPLRRPRLVGEALALGPANGPLRAGMMEPLERSPSAAGRRSSRCKRILAARPQPAGAGRALER